jgi:hypothetical protein
MYFAPEKCVENSNIRISKLRISVILTVMVILREWIFFHFIVPSHFLIFLSSQFIYNPYKYIR